MAAGFEYVGHDYEVYANVLPLAFEFKLVQPIKASEQSVGVIL